MDDPTPAHGTKTAVTTNPASASQNPVLRLPPPFNVSTPNNAKAKALQDSVGARRIKLFMVEAASAPERPNASASHSSATTEWTVGYRRAPSRRRAGRWR